ncbi:MAPK protein hog1 [Aspergillus nanangensis]|uniref:mitogen-activated protein kinase n=1 Tax=Aspergillus nanangensis TaxID=2582783 RepID=A0AAD4CZJ4_ASPNN|nr:MAPK protein hog1 [Aspergillus nanangensis]
MATFVRTEVLGTSYETSDRYTDLEARGCGASGVICSAYDRLIHEQVAVKKIGKPFEDGAFAKRTYREVHLLSKLKHDNLINLKDLFISPSEDLYLVTDFLMTDLHQLIQSRPLENQFVQFFTYQILRGLKYIHSAGVVHRDLKPSNILVNDNCDLKICDFGLAREHEHHMTGYVATRYYRAPEIMLTWQQYSYGVDMWSVGCILAEMIKGTPLFPGRNHIDQFATITQLLGNPPPQVVERIYSKNTLKFIESLPPRERIPLSSILNDSADREAINLLERMLHLDPYQRIPAADALSHPYVLSYHDAEDEPVADGELNWVPEEMELSIYEWKAKMYSEVIEFHRGACTSHVEDQLDANQGLTEFLRNDIMVDTY